jgi:hypothetical protein
MSSHHNDKATFLERLIFNNRPAVIVARPPALKR